MSPRFFNAFSRYVSCSLLGQRYHECQHFKVIASGELAFDCMRAAWRKQTGHCAFLVLADNRRYACCEQLLRMAHVFAVLGGFVEAGAGASVGQVATQRQALEPVENAFGLRVGQQHGTVVADMDRRIARLERSAG